MNITNYLIPIIYGLVYATVAVPGLAGVRSDIISGDLIYIFPTAFVIVFGVKLLLNKKNYLAILMLTVLVFAYSLKIAYIETLLIAQADYHQYAQSIIVALFDTFNTGHLNYSAEIYSSYLAYYSVLLISIIISALILPVANYKSLGRVFNSQQRYSKIGAISFIILFSSFGVAGLLILNSISFGISSSDPSIIDRLPYKLDTIIFMLLRYGLSFIGVVRYMNISNTSFPNKYPLAKLTKIVILLYYILFSLYSSSKEYLIIALVLLVFDLFRDFSFITSKISLTSCCSRVLKLILKVSLIALLAFSIITINTTSRYVRNYSCTKCSGFEAAQKATYAFINGNHKEFQMNMGDYNTANIPVVDSVLLSTVLRVQGADNLLQIILKDHTSNTSPDIFGPFAAITGYREAPHQFYYYDILPYERIGTDLAVAFPPSFVGWSLQKSLSIINPAIFGATIYALYTLLISTLLSLNSLLPIMTGLAMTYESLKTMSEGSVSTPLLLIALSVAITYKILGVYKKGSPYA